MVLLLNDFILIFVCAFLVTILFGYPILTLVRKRKCNQTILEYVEVHSEKKNTPTMGGFIFLFSIILVMIPLLFQDNSFLLLLALLAMLGFAVIGFLDDFIKVKYKRNLGLTPWQKILGQGGIALILSLFCYFSPLSFNTFLPFNFQEINLSFFLVPIVFLVVVATTNSVNLIDGLDGLCSKVTCVYVVCFGVILSLFANNLFVSGFSNTQVVEIQNLAKGCICVGGALLGFLMFNTNKALIFMGDIGSLALGGFVSAVSVLSGLWLYIPILGILYLITAISVILQVIVFKKTRKRMFLMAPLHHHFEKKGFNETKIVTYYTIISIILGLICIYLTIK